MRKLFGMNGLVKPTKEQKNENNNINPLNNIIYYIVIFFFLKIEINEIRNKKK